MGISSVDEVQPRMKQQVFDPSSPLNIFRMDDEEKTISQCLMNLTKLEFTFFHDDRTAKSLVFDKQIKEPKIKVNLVRHGA